MSCLREPRGAGATYEDDVSPVFEGGFDECGSNVQMLEDVRAVVVFNGYVECFKLRQSLRVFGSVLDDRNDMRDADCYELLFVHGGIEPRKV